MMCWYVSNPKTEQADAPSQQFHTASFNLWNTRGLFFARYVWVSFDFFHLEAAAAIVIILFFHVWQKGISTVHLPNDFSEFFLRGILLLH